MDLLRFALLGLGVGAAYVLIGQGIVLIYRASGLLNFAQGGIALVAAHVFYSLRDSEHLPTAVALVAALLSAGLIGLAMQVLVLRRLRGSSAIVRLIATLGLLTLIQGAGVVLWGYTNPQVSGLLPVGRFNLGAGLVIGQDRIFLLGIGLLLSLVLWIVYGRTKYGLATSAVAENQSAATTLGWSPDLIEGANWVIGAMLAGLAGVLLAPLSGLSVNILVLSVIPGLAAALVGQFSSFWLVLAGGLGIGVIQSEFLAYVPQSGWSQAVPFIIIIAIVVFRGRALPVRGEASERPVRVGTGRVLIYLLAITAVAGIFIIYRLNGDWQLAVTNTALMGLVALSMVVLTGYAGQISLAQLPIAGIGALAAANAASRWGFPFEVAVAFGVAAALAVGLVVALPALRCRGSNLAVVTMGLGLVIESLVLANSTLGGGLAGLNVPSPALFGLDMNPIIYPARFAAAAVIVFLLCALVVANLRRGATGRRLLALRVNERAAAGLGINVLAAKMYAFGAAAALAGLAGALAAFESPSLDVTPYTTLNSITLIIQSMIGGIGYIFSAVFGGAGASGGILPQALSGLNQTWTSAVTAASGLLVLLTLVAHPDGVVDTAARFTHVIASRYGRRLRPLRRQPRPASGLRTRPATRETPQAPERIRGALEVRGLSVSFGGVLAVDNAVLTVEPGEVVGLIGPNGAGKTTLIDAISGLVRCRGSLRLAGHSLDRLPAQRRARAGLGRTFQSLDLFDDIPVLDNIRVAAESSGWTALFSDLIRPRSRPLPAVAQEAIEALALGDILALPPESLPAGRRRLVGIARALATGPSVILLDEPAAGLNEAERRELATLVRRLADVWGLAVLLVEHDVSLVASVSDRVVAMNLGQVIAEGRPDDVLADPQVLSSYLGITPAAPAGPGDIPAPDHYEVTEGTP